MYTHRGEVWVGMDKAQLVAAEKVAAEGLKMQMDGMLALGEAEASGTGNA